MDKKEVCQDQFDADARKVFELGAVIANALCDQASTEASIRTGGVFALAALINNDRTGEELMVTAQPAGKITDEDRVRFAKNAAVKVTAMHEQDVVSSAAIANENANPPVYGGGIKLSNDWYLSFSGFPPVMDEVVCLVTAERLGYLDELRINSIISASPNEALLRVRFFEATFRVAEDILKYEKKS